mmetsp:Transcript_37991/g.100487  ORF Transcript_37991/g.100487 Transcript_37991/m.100487 type:complete len:298 (+) Transcript_37991:933-1826(+)
MHNLLLLLLDELRDELVDGLMHLGHRVQLQGDDQSRELRVIRLAEGGLQHRRGVVPGPPPVELRRLALLEEVEGLAELVVGVVGAEDLNGLGHGRHLFLAHLHALVVLLLGGRAPLLEVLQEDIVKGDGVPSVLDVLEGQRVPLVGLRQLGPLRVDRRLAGANLRLLRRLQLLVGLGVLRLLLLRLREVVLERLFHLPQDAEDLAGRRLVRLQVGRGERAGDVAALVLEEGRDQPPLPRGDRAQQQLLVHLHLHPHGLHGKELKLGRTLGVAAVQEGVAPMVLGEHDDGAAQRLNGL